MSAAETSGGPIHPDLTAQALLYANGELEGPEVEAFEQRLAGDQQAREALCQAVLLTQTLAGWQPPRPDPAYRDRVREQLRPAAEGRIANPSHWWTGLLTPRVYRGHPVVWLLTGGLAASLLVFCFAPRHAPIAPVSPAGDQTEVRPPQQPAPAEPNTPRMAEVWAELHSISHLERVRAEETRRKQRLEERRVARTEERPARGTPN